jgi:hypothetical protein
VKQQNETQNCRLVTGRVRLLYAPEFCCLDARYWPFRDDVKAKLATKQSEADAAKRVRSPLARRHSIGAAIATGCCNGRQSVRRLRVTPLSRRCRARARRPNSPADEEEPSRLSVKPNVRVEVSSLEPHEFASFFDVDGTPIGISAV